MWQSGTRVLRLAYGQMFLIATNTSGDDGQDWKRWHYVLHQQPLYLLILELDSTCFILALYYSRKGQDVEGASKVGSSAAQKTIKCQVLSGVSGLHCSQLNKLKNKRVS